MLYCILHQMTCAVAVAVARDLTLLLSRPRHSADTGCLFYVNPLLMPKLARYSCAGAEDAAAHL
jgi:hypothetical protein